MRWTANSVKRVALSVAALIALGGAAPSARSLFERARAEESKLQSSKRLKSSARPWWEVARRYHQVVLADPKSGYCDDALYYEAETYREIDRRFTDRQAARRALSTYARLIEGYPKSKWVSPAKYARADLLLNRLSDADAGRAELRALARSAPRSEEAKKARRILSDWEHPKEPSSLVAVRNIRHWVGRDYTRIVIDVDREVPFSQERLKDPDRIFFDLQGTSLSTSLETRAFPVADAFLKQIRVAQNKPDVVRVVFDFESISRYNVFSLQDPYRMVVDILGERPDLHPPVVADVIPAPAPIAPGPPASGDALTPESGPVEPAPTATAAPEPTVDGRFPLTRQLGLAARRVVVDAGHGGHDPGAIGRGGLKEKDLVLDVSHRLARQLEASGYEVILTRDDDTFIPLEERTAIANSKDADLFVSVHANSSRNRRARGIETYYLNLATTPEAEETAARENAITSRSLGELQGLLKQIMNNSKIAESREFAGRLQRSLAASLVMNRNARDLGVKTAPFYVLLGANMPSVLVEVSFVSNPDEERLLETEGYREEIAGAILEGIQGYTASLKPIVATSSRD